MLSRFLNYNGSARRNGSGQCGDATMLRDNLAGLIEPIMGIAGTITLALSQFCKLHRARYKASDDRPRMP
jgi:hypothetical protein